MGLSFRAKPNCLLKYGVTNQFNPTRHGSVFAAHRKCAPKYKNKDTTVAKILNNSVNR
jgi:hypothetical protein